MSSSSSAPENVTLFEEGPPDLPRPEALENGLSIERVFSVEGEHPFDSVTWETRDAAIKNHTGEAIFEQKGVEFPTAFSQLATNIVASKYFYGDLDDAGTHPAEGGRERSLKQLVHRVTRTIADWGEEDGYFATKADADTFYDELTWLCTNQYGAFNSPVWFNVGLGQQYGIRDTGGKTIFGWDFKQNKVVSVDPYERPQASACFIISVEDSIDDIWSLMGESARLFKFGSGVGADWSTLRSTREKLSGGGVPSGPVSFMKVQDETGATIKSGGKCLAPYTQVYTAERGPIAVEELAGLEGEWPFLTLSYDPPAGRMKVKRARAWRSGIKEVVRVHTDKGHFDLSFDHPVKLASGPFEMAGNLEPGQRLFQSTLDPHSAGYVRVGLRDGKKGRALLHRMVAEDVMGLELDGLSVHHKDENKFNNHPTNLEAVPQAKHARLHNEALVEAGEHVFQHAEDDPRFDSTGQNNGMHRTAAFWQDEGQAKAYRRQKRAEMMDRDPSVLQHAAVRQRYMNTGWRLINAGHDLSTLNDFFAAYEKEIGRIDSKPRRHRAFAKQFGGYDGFLAELDASNHCVRRVEWLGEMAVYSVEVECPTRDDKSSRSGHNYLLWSGDNEDVPFGTGVVVSNTRRAAIMQTLKCWHPDVLEFVEAKQQEERKAWALIEEGYDGSFNGPAYGSVAFQNVNQSLRVTDAFMEAADAGESFELRAVTTGETVEEIDAAMLLEKVAEGTHVCGDPGLQYEDTIQKWHTVKNTGPINSSNPCCFTGDTLVMTSDGPLRFDVLHARYEELAQRHSPALTRALLPRTRTVAAMAMAGGAEEIEHVEVRIKKVWVAGEADTLIEVTTTTGARLRSTPDHRYLTFGGDWVEAHDLKAGVRLVAGDEDAGAVHVESVRGLTPSAPVKVYDLEVDSGLHSFSVAGRGGTGGVVVHNSEYMHLDDSACNLASLNLRKYQKEDGSVDVERLRAAARIFITAQEILVDHAGYPSHDIAVNSHAFRPLGLGFANLGALLMSMGLPYDSDEGRAVAGAITAIEHCEAYARSAEIAANKTIGTFEGFAENEEPMLEVMRLHRAAVQDIDPTVPDYLKEAAQESADRMVALGQRHGYRNAQATVLAPTGTIGFYMDCDTTGIEPDIALVKYKLLAGEGDGMMKIVNQTVPLALERLGYSADEIKAIIEYVDQNDTIEGAPELKDEHLPVFDCAFEPAGGERSIHHLGHIKMMAACQPFISGAISKTCNVPESATVEDIADAYLKSWELGLKAVAIYRENSKRSQPLSTKKDGNTQKTAATQRAASDTDPSGDGAMTAEPEVRIEEKVVYKPVRKRLPDERPSITHKFSIAGHEGYLHIGLYADTKQPGEIFITMAKQGSTLAGMMDAFATSISIALQYGVPLKDLVSKFSHMRFEPSGFTNNKQVPMAKSIMDYIFRYLSIKFLEQEVETPDKAPTAQEAEDTVDPNEAAAEEARRSGPAADTEQGELALDAPAAGTPAVVANNPAMDEALDQPSGAAPDPLVGQTVEAFMSATDAATQVSAARQEELAQSFKNQEDAPPCSNCGSITVRSGACYQCINCGTSTGCG